MNTQQLIPTHRGLDAAERFDETPPDASRLIDALRQIGYSFEQAISDLVDNAISANASRVLIRFVRSGDELMSIAVADNGEGMTAAQMADAMRFGSSPRTCALSLGKFGMGLKLASLSHAACLTVASSRKGLRCGRRWTLEGIRKGWECGVLTREEVGTLTAAPWGPVDLVNTGTIVKWDQIDKLPISKNGLKQTLRSLHRKLDLHLGLHFHRFLESGRLRIFVDQQEIGEREHQVRVEIAPLNPFDYAESGDPEWPRPYRLKLDGAGTLKLEGHIWPPNSDDRAYKLGGRSAARQGFYFYRNDRLIQAGGWNGLVESEAEPHSSLARVRVDLPPSLDETFSLNVQKSSVIVPNGFADAVKASRCSVGTSFESYRARAEDVYRQLDGRAEKLKTVIPGAGLPKALSRRISELKGVQPEDGREVTFQWLELNEDEFFRIDRENSQILLNSAYRSLILAGLDESRTDVPLFKTLLFLMLEQDFMASKTGPKRERELEFLNRAVVEAVSYGAG